MLPKILIAIWFALPAIAWLVQFFIGKRTGPILLGILCVLTAITGYAVLVSSVMAVDRQLEAEMNSFDLDGDGGISGAELTPAAQLAIDEWASDTGRSFAPIIGAPLTLIWYAIVFATLIGGEWIVRNHQLARHCPDDQQPD